MKTVLTITACMLLAFFFYGCKEEKKGKPKIESHCTMNGYGSGKCSFTNKGTGTGATCVKIKVYVEKDLKKNLNSSTICSGKVGVKETKNKEFSIPGVNDLCTGYGVPWSKACAFLVLPDNS